MSLKPGLEIDLQIDRLAHGGAGVGRFDGVVVFVPLTAPGDLVRAQILDVKKTYATATLKNILSPASSRREAPCPYFTRCGGCNWQHVSYAEQLQQKNGFVRHLTERNWPHAVIEPIVPSPNEWRYRRRVQIHVEESQAGFLKRGSHEIVDIQDCLITKESLVTKFEGLRANGKKRRKKFEIVEELQGDIQVIDLETDPYVFLQVNPEQNQNMIEYVLEKIGQHPPKIIYDLYCGAGNFTLPLAKKYPAIQVVGVESNKDSAKLAKNRGLNLKNLEIVTSDVAKYLNDQNVLRDSAIILDPPRAGVVPAVIDVIKKIRPRLIIYVSCHPATASRDWKAFEPEFRLSSVRPLDMFPQTDHVELVSVLSDPARLD